MKEVKAWYCAARHYHPTPLAAAGCEAAAALLEIPALAASAKHYLASGHDRAVSVVALVENAEAVIKALTPIMHVKEG